MCKIILFDFTDDANALFNSVLRHLIRVTVYQLNCAFYCNLHKFNCLNDVDNVLRISVNENSCNVINDHFVLFRAD